MTWKTDLLAKKSSVLGIRTYEPVWMSETRHIWMSEARRKVLIVDDDGALLNFIRILLSSVYDVETASDGQRALALAESMSPDVIVLDLRMPVMDGRAVYQELRSRDIDSKVVILSAYGAEEARLELGADAYLPKPFDPDRLLTTVRRVLSSDGPADPARSRP